MRDDVSLREIPWRAEAALQLAEEREVQVHFLVAGAVEGADGRRRQAAGRLDAIREDRELRLDVLPPLLAEDVVPDVLRAAEDGRGELPRLLLLGVHGPRGLCAGRGAGVAARVE